MYNFKYKIIFYVFSVYNSVLNKASTAQRLGITTHIHWDSHTLHIHMTSFNKPVFSNSEVNLLFIGHAIVR